VRTKSL